jgi:2-hydroxy-3-keto-5-methylthiopentenyl-1-phosphate phosphatase
MRERLVVDWDGTVTEVDGLHLVLCEFGDVDVYEEAEARLGRTLTLHEVIALEFETIRAPLDDVVAWIRANVAIRAGFTELARRHEPLIVSSGFHELIGPVLAREEIELEVVANRLDPRAEGWRALFRQQPVCDVCGQMCKRADVAGVGPFVYVGDGFSDRCVAEAASRVFARDGLATYLAEREVPFETYRDFYDVAGALDDAAAASP